MPAGDGRVRAGRRRVRAGHGRPLPCRVLLVGRPSGGIVGDVFPKLREVGGVAHDMVVISTLPEGRTRRALNLVYPFHHRRFEHADDRAEVMAAVGPVMAGPARERLSITDREDAVKVIGK